MRTTFIKILCFLPFLFISLQSIAQYNTALGIRFGDPGRGITFLQYIDPQSRGAADFLITTQYKGFCFTGLYEIHSKNHNIKVEVANVGLYIGAGFHVGTYKENEYFAADSSYTITDKRTVAAGIDVIGGVEWKIPNIPLLLSGDLKPFYDLTRGKKKQLNYLEYALNLRWLF